MDRKYKIITLDLQKSLIDFLDEMQFEAAKTKDDKESMHIINFCNYAIKELIDSFDGYLKDKPKQGPQKKSRDQYVEETFMDWNIPEMTDEEYEKLVDQFDAFLRGWEKEYNKKNPQKKQIKKRPTKEDYKPHVDDVMEYCSLDEVIEFLKDDPELTDQERFDLYYDERERRKPKEKGLTYEQLLKGANIKPPTKK